MTSAVTPSDWRVSPAHYTGRPPGTDGGGGWAVSSPSPDPWVDEGGSWARAVANASLVLEDSNGTALDQLAGAVNRSVWPGGKLRLGVEVELFPEWAVGGLTGLLVTLLAVGVFGNVLVIVVVLRTRDLRSSTNLLLVNLALADLLVLAVSLPTALIELHSRPETWVLGQPMCMLVPFVEYCVCHASVLTILVISFERYYAICRPLRASYTCTKMRAWTCILSIWCSAVVLSSPMLVMSTHEWVPYADGSTVPVCFTDLTSLWSCLYINVVTAVFFFVPMVLLILLYLVIGRNLMQDSASAALNHRKVDLPNMRARKQVVVTLATVTVVFFICLFPFRVLTLWIVWTPREVIKDFGALHYYSVLYAARVLLFVNSAGNPVLYNFTSTKFRDAFSKLLTSDSRRRQLSRQSTFNTTGTSMSNGRSGSSRTVPLEVIAIHPAKMALGRIGRHASLDDFPSAPRPNMARYGRQSSFGAFGASSTCSSAACSRQNSRAGDNGAMTPVEARRAITADKRHSGEGHRLFEGERRQSGDGRRNVDGEQRHSGEGRRLLEGERRSVSQDMIEEEMSATHLGRNPSMRRMQERSIDTEDVLLTEDHRDPLATPAAPAVIETSLTLPAATAPAEPALTPSHESSPNASLHEKGKDSPEPGKSKNDQHATTSVGKENGKSVLFCESLSTKVIRV